MSIFTPSAWEGISTVTVVILVAVGVGLALVRGWLVLGTAHRELLRLKDEVIADARGTRTEDRRIIQTLSDTVHAQRVNGDWAVHLLESVQANAAAAANADRRQT
ncbi:hypothetical protein [Rhodococcus sp. (in: high G+C Gram-positive bacteria)]|uniref:hypothetical protein n=1 Tax=Rhodococcus sp. TaxID=1831 RepID=UPI0006421847|nr:hypothetical protein [Rhodococcus sp. (in: high G+C Gram-positive bacteria)]KLN67610.1 hypothetical protein ABM90_31210 [Rhodococcus erythropolis]MBJ7479262.1 hypothetical protein [Rhodococcus sp. (in: high G+C Gram-positive bacteria)]